ncbi:MAG: ParB/RepB/Spo0J family partition protein [Eggerthellaceae bacterium]|nr:ParB/RepB/Spo0J family partition protein [Eggerthellaceae bacterium]
MAKQRKSGLGRGLNSLWGESVGEISQSHSNENSERAEEKAAAEKAAKVAEEEAADKKEERAEEAAAEEAALSSAPSRAPISTTFSEEEAEKATIKERTASDRPVSPAAARAIESEQALQRATLREADAKKPVPYIEEDDHVTIKGVVAREARPNVSRETKQTDLVDIDLVAPNPDQPRTSFDKEELAELSKSIEKEGLLQPILVRKMDGGTYQIIAGERRWQACKLAGLKQVPVRVKDVEDDKALELALIENIQRSDLNPIEEAYGYKRLMERQHLTQAEVARAVSKGRSTIANALRLLELPEDAQQMLFEGKITAGHARAILSVPTPEGREKLTNKLREEKLSVRQTENLARLLAGQAAAKSEDHKRPATPPVFKKAARELRQHFNTGVRIKSVRGKNKIEIEFKDEADLERLFQQLMDRPAPAAESAEEEA